ncbi:MAG: DUF2809 domain-containing protein, partial [Armatimonadaceae bacterium]
GSRLVCAIGCAGCIAFGLVSRRYGAVFPDFVATYAGDMLWAATVMLGLGLISPAARPARKAWLAIGISFTVEFSQLNQTPWLDTLRRTTPGALLLGRGFLWSDLACYVAGVVLGLGFDGLRRCFQRCPTSP